MPCTLWWSRSGDGIVLEATYGIRLMHSRTLDVESARDAFSRVAIELQD